MSQHMLPSGWVLARIGDLCLSVNAINFRNRISSSFQYIDISSIDREQKSIMHVDEIDNAEAPSRARQLVLKNDVLVSTVRPGLNAVALVPESLNNEVCSTGFCVLRANSNILDTGYLFAWVRSSTFIQNLARVERGIGYPSVSNSDVENTQIPLPPLPEQRRIAAILREGDEIRKLRQQANEKAQKIVESLFYDMFGDPEINPKAWETKLLSEVGMLDRGKSQHRPRDAAHLYGGPYPLIQTGNVSNSNGLITTYNQTYSDAGLAQSRLWKKGTLCITIAANIARTSILTFDACFPDSIVGFIPGPSVTVEYVRQWFVTIQDRLEKFAPQAAQKNINLEILRNLHIPTPAISLQNKFTSFFNEIYEDIHQQNSLSFLLDALYQALLTQAFNGELTASWRESHMAELQQAAEERDGLLSGLSAVVKAPILQQPDTSQLMERAELTKGLTRLQTALLQLIDEQRDTYFTATRVHDDIWLHMDEQGVYQEEADREGKYTMFAGLDCSLDTIRRELHFLAQMGLSKELTLPDKEEYDISTVHYITAYRSLRADDDCQQQDLALLHADTMEEALP